MSPATASRKSFSLGENGTTSPSGGSGVPGGNTSSAPSAHTAPRLTVSRGPDGSDKPLAGGEVQTHEAFRYGYFEVRMRVPRDGSRPEREGRDQRHQQPHRERLDERQRDLAPARVKTIADAQVERALELVASD